MPETLEQEFDALQQQFRELALDPDDELLGRYEMKRPPMPPGLYWKLRWIAGWTLNWLEEKGVWRRERWPVNLKDQANDKAKPLLIWALGTDRDTLRRACEGFRQLQESLPEFALVLVTDVADFAHFSRLGWLVEYVPQLHGTGESYDVRKLRFLASLYQGAPVLPVNAGLETDRLAADIRRHLSGNV